MYALYLRIKAILLVKFIFSKKATKIENIFTAFLTLCSKCQIDGEDLVIFCGLIKKHEHKNYERDLIGFYRLGYVTI